MSDSHVLVMAKAPRPGEVKTRLCPPCELHEAAELAAASLADTLDAALASRAGRVCLALDGEPGDWIPAGVEVFAQRGPDFGHRLDAAWARVGGPGVQVGMDTPQLSAGHLDDALARLEAGADSVLGLAADGGWWAIGLTSPPPELFAPVPMSSTTTGVDQLARCRALGLTPQLLDELVDVDTFADARRVAAAAPASRFARCFAGLAALEPATAGVATTPSTPPTTTDPRP